MEEEKKIRQRIALLQDEHRSLDLKIATMITHMNMLEVQRLKKHKLCLKDELARLSDMLVPDIIA